MTRPSPSDRLTLAEAATAAEVTYHVAYRRVTSGQIPSAEQGAGGVWTIAREDVGLIRRRERRHAEYKAYNLKVSPERAAAWQRAAGKRSVQAWLSALADAASGYQEEP